MKIAQRSLLGALVLTNIVDGGVLDAAQDKVEDQNAENGIELL